MIYIYVCRGGSKMKECKLYTIELDVIDHNPISIAIAIIDHFNKYTEIDNALIMLQETAEHIESHVKAVTKIREAGHK